MTPAATFVPDKPHKRFMVVDSNVTPTTVRPVRAAFGPHLSLVSIDNTGHLWMRFSTALIMLTASLTLVLIPLIALWFVGNGLAESGQVSFQKQNNHSLVNIKRPEPSGPTQLPLAGH